MDILVRASLAVGARVEFRNVKLTGESSARSMEEYRYFFAGTDLSVNILDHEDKSNLDINLPRYASCPTRGISFIEGNVVGLILSQISEDEGLEVGEVSALRIQAAIDFIAEELEERFNYVGEVKVFFVKGFPS